jgi:hypothetical protein
MKGVFCIENQLFIKKLKAGVDVVFEGAAWKRVSR